jgi:predicted Zn finger-like uncharacterized protein
MRLVCPNCDAEYEVDAAVIPDGGRDVQCSNCGHAWFQNSPAVEAEIAAEEALYEAPPALSDRGPAPASEGEPAKAKPDAPQQSIDASVLAVLKEEAEREVEARRAETPPMEVQTDMALQAPAAETGSMGAAARRLARMKGVEPPRPAVRSESFPEVDEINSTLRASSEKRAGSAAVTVKASPQASGRAGFRSGFVLMLLLAVVVVAVYVMAPKLALQFPEAAGALKAYVSFIDAARLWLDANLQKAIGFLRGLAGSTAG